MESVESVGKDAFEAHDYVAHVGTGLVMNGERNLFSQLVEASSVCFAVRFFDVGLPAPSLCGFAVGAVLGLCHNKSRVT